MAGGLSLSSSPSSWSGIYIGEHTIVLAIFEVEVIELQYCDFVLLCSNYTYPLREVCSNHGVLEISWHSISTHHADQRQDVVGKYGRNQLHIF
jgi:hypothetical protein